MLEANGVMLVTNDESETADVKDTLLNYKELWGYT
jgi:hypothetical protein